jgi:hypothetical protein
VYLRLGIFEQNVSQYSFLHQAPEQVPRIFIAFGKKTVRLRRVRFLKDPAGGGEFKNRNTDNIDKCI